MKRLLAQIGITCFAVLAIAFYLPDTAVMILLFAAIIASILLFALKKTRKKRFIPLMALTAAVACAANLAFSLFYVAPVQERCTGDAIPVEATLTDEVYHSGSRYCYRLKTDRINGEAAGVNLLLQTVVPIEIEPFDHVSFTADLYATQNTYYLSKGYYISVDIDYDTFGVIPGEEKPLYWHIIRLRQRFREALDAYLPEDCASLCKAVFVGDKYALDPSVKQDFRYAGVSHFIVVSGMHFSVLCMLVLRLFRKMRSHRALIFGVMLPVILLYMFVTGMQPSVVRSGIMMLMLAVSGLIRRIGDPHSSLGLAGLVLPVIFTPYGAGDIGLILSYFTTFAILTWADPIAQKLKYKGRKRILSKILRPVTEMIAVSLAANIFVIPISIFVFNGFSTVTLVSSLLLYVPIYGILILSLGVCLFYFLGPLCYLSLVLSWPLYILCRLVLLAVEGLSSLSFSYLFVGARYVYIWLTVTILLAAAVYLLRRRVRLWPYAVLVSALLFIGGTLVHTVSQLNTVSLEVFDCGAGLTAGLDYHGDLYLFGFKAKAKEAYPLLNELQMKYGGAALAVCGEASDYRNYTRMDDREFAISDYMLYDIDDAKGELTDALIANTVTRYDIDSGVSFTVCPAKRKVMTYLTVGETDILILPNHFPYKKIPDKCRRADIIVMTTYTEGYEQLLCDTLVVSNTPENSRAIAVQMQGVYQHYTDTSSGNVSIDLR
jgi:ComEC/Rec2-related protein